MGGYFSLIATARLQVDGQILLAPDFCLNGYGNPEITFLAYLTTVVHGWGDTGAPVQKIYRFAKLH